MRLFQKRCQGLCSISTGTRRSSGAESLNDAAFVVDSSPATVLPARAFGGELFDIVLRTQQQHD